MPEIPSKGQRAACHEVRLQSNARTFYCVCFYNWVLESLLCPCIFINLLLFVRCCKVYMYISPTAVELRSWCSSTAGHILMPSYIYDYSCCIRRGMRFLCVSNKQVMMKLQAARRCVRCTITHVLSHGSSTLTRRGYTKNTRSVRVGLRSSQATRSSAIPIVRPGALMVMHVT